DVAVHEIAFDKAGKLVASAGGDKTVRLWNGVTGEPIRTLPAASVAYAVALRPDGKQVAAGCFDGVVRVWDASNARLLATLAHLPANGDAIEWVALTPEGYVTGSELVLKKGVWLSGGKPLIDVSRWKTVLDSTQVAKALRGEKVNELVTPSPMK